MLEQNLLPLEEGMFLEDLLKMAIMTGLLNPGDDKDAARIVALRKWIADRDQRRDAFGTH